MLAESANLYILSRIYISSINQMMTYVGVGIRNGLEKNCIGYSIHSSIKVLTKEYLRMQIHTRHRVSE